MADVPVIPDSDSPNGKMHAVMDVDRDPTLSPAWKGDSFPKIEITQKSTGRVLGSISYFGSPGDDARPLREHVRVMWRPDSEAFAINVEDRFYSSCAVYVLNREKRFVAAPVPSDYEKMTGFPTPDPKHLRPRGRDSAVGWDERGRLIYSIFRSPRHTFSSRDPLRHTVYLEVRPTKVTPVKVEHDHGEWKNGDWVPTNAEQTNTVNPGSSKLSK